MKILIAISTLALLCACSAVADEPRFKADVPRNITTPDRIPTRYVGDLKFVDRVGISSRDKERLKMNADGSVDLYFAPKAPKGLESNWIPTGESFFLLFRLYGTDKPMFDRTWVLDDVKKVK